MGEKDLVSQPDTIKYQGPFVVAELYKFIDELLDDRNYDRRDKDHSEAVKPDGKYIELVLRPARRLPQNARSELWLDLKLSKIKDIDLEVDGKKKKMQEGEVWINIRGFIETDLEGKWESNPGFVVIRSLLNKFLFRSQYEVIADEVKKDCKDLKNELKSFLNFYKKR